MILRFNMVFCYALCLSYLSFFTVPLYSYAIIQEMCNAPFIIDKSGSWIVEDDLVLHGMQGIVIKANDVELNLNNKHVTGSHDVIIGIAIYGNNCIVKNGTLDNFNNTGIALYQTEEVVVENVSIHNSQKGICMYGGSCNKLHAITVERAYAAGLYLQNAPYSNITLCTITDCKEYGLYIDGQCDGSLCDGLTIARCGECGLYIASNNMQCSCAQIKECDDSGVTIEGDAVTCCTIFSAYNYTGFHIYGSNVVLHTCTASHNMIDGLIIDVGSKNTKVCGGIYSANGATGINNHAVSTKVYGVSAHANTKRDMMRVFNAVA